MAAYRIATGRKDAVHTIVQLLRVTTKSP